MHIWKKKQESELKIKFRFFLLIKKNHLFLRELQYVLPLKSRPLFPEFFSTLDSRKESLSITGYGLQDVSLEEVFLKVTEQYKKSPKAAEIDAQFNNSEGTDNATDMTASS